jgi:hypothetical protein
MHWSQLWGGGVVWVGLLFNTRTLNFISSGLIQYSPLLW